MKLVESDVRLSEVCRAVEAKLHGVQKLQPLAVTVMLRSNFESESTPALRNSPSGYRASTSRIEINASVFFQLSLEAQKAALAHEIAHILLQFEPHVDQIPGYEEILADWHVCNWGFIDGLKEERMKSYGPEYCANLALWPIRDDFVKNQGAWQMRRLIGTQSRSPRTE